MYQQKKQSSWRNVFIVVIVCTMLDFLMLGACSARFIQWTSAAYIVALLAGAPWLLLGVAAWSSVMINTLLHGRVIDEIALTVLIGSLGLFLAQRTISSPFAQRMLASFLMTISIVGTAFLWADGSWGMILSCWTLFQIIANIIIVNMLLKYTS